MNDTSADFSLVNAVFQFAVLSRMMRTFGRSAAMLGLARNMSVSSFTGSKAAAICAHRARTAITRILSKFRVIMVLLLR